MTTDTPTRARSDASTAPARWAAVLAVANRLRTSDDSVSRLVRAVLVVAGFTGVSVLVRGAFIANPHFLNPDEVEMLAQGMAARHSPVPFTTWLTATSGPVWPLFLALLAAIGAPVTIAFVHLLSAVFYGLIGAFAYVLARRALGSRLALLITAFLWIPLVLALIGEPADFGAMETELLPAVLILGAAVIPAHALARYPWLYAISGVLAGLAVGAKYQALPLVPVLLAVPLVLSGETRRRVLARRAAVWVAGAALPAVVLGAAMLLSPAVSGSSIAQMWNFLSFYSDRLPLEYRFWATVYRLTEDHVLVLMLLVGWLGLLSTRKVGLLRAGVLACGAAALAFGGYGWWHYLVFVYAAIAIAIGLPLRPGTRVLPIAGGTPRRVAIVSAVAVTGWLLSVGPAIHRPELTNPREFAAALSADNVDRDPRLAAACPPGSHVVMWGWAPELYANYSWRNAIPVFNVYFWTAVPANYAPAYEVVRAAIDNPETKCVIEAVGDPFYAPPGQTTPELDLFFPALAGALADQYRTVSGVIDCEVCTVHVRSP